MSQRPLPFPLKRYQSTPIPKSQTNSPNRNIISPVETSFERPESPTLPPELDSTTAVRDEKTENEFSHSSPTPDISIKRLSRFSHNSTYSNENIYNSTSPTSMTDYSQMSDKPNFAFIRRAKSQRQTINKLPLLNKNSNSINNSTVSFEEERVKSLMTNVTSPRKIQPSVERWAAIELSIVNREMPPAPTAAMYWSRALTYGHGPQGPLRSHTANIIGERLYVFGGCDNKTCFNILYILDLDTLTWTKPQLYSRFIPPPCRAHTSTAVERILSNGRVQNQLYVFGGGNGPDYFNEVYVLDIETLVWTMPNITNNIKPPRRRAHTACLWNEKIVIIGGGDGLRALDDVYMLDISDPDQLKWELLEIANSPPIARGYHTATIVKDKIVLIGGSDGHDCFSDIFILDLMKKTWIQVDTDLRIPRLTHSATLVGSYVFVFGGHDSRKYSQDIILFNLVSMNWERRKVHGSAPKARGYHTAILYDSRLYILGGYDGKHFFDDVYILELSSFAYLPQITNFELET